VILPDYLMLRQRAQT